MSTGAESPGKPAPRLASSISTDVYSHPCHWRRSASTSTSLDNTELLVKPYIRPFHRFFWRVHDLDLHLSPQERASSRFLSSFREQTGSIPSLSHGFDNQDARQAIQPPPCHPERSEGSGRQASQILRCAQDDMPYLQISFILTIFLTV